MTTHVTVANNTTTPYVAYDTAYTGDLTISKCVTGGNSTCQASYYITSADTIKLSSAGIEYYLKGAPIITNAVSSVSIVDSFPASYTTTLGAISSQLYIMPTKSTAYLWAVGKVPALVTFSDWCTVSGGTGSDSGDGNGDSSSVMYYWIIFFVILIIAVIIGGVLFYVKRIKHKT